MPDGAAARRLPAAAVADAPTSRSTRASTCGSRAATARATRDGTPSDDGRSALWVHVAGGTRHLVGALAIIADWMPSGIGQALGRWAGGNSLDNTIRILRPSPTAWVLCDIQIHGVQARLRPRTDPSVERGRRPDGDRQPIGDRAPLRRPARLSGSGRAERVQLDARCRAGCGARASSSNSLSSADVVERLRACPRCGASRSRRSRGRRP